MKRSHYIDFITTKLSALASEIELRGKLNHLDRHLHAETFYLHLFNELFGWRLDNLNVIKPNAAAIDLVDHTNKIIIQVSATATKAKVESALAKDLKLYSGYTFKFISISKDANALRSKNLKNPYSLSFNPQKDIYDVASLLRHINNLNIDELAGIADLIKKELASEVDPIKLESNLAAIINILAKEDWSSNDRTLETIPFDIESKIDHNNLDAARDIIDDYVVHHNRVDKIYAEYNREGNNKSLSVLAAIQRYYLTHRTKFNNDDLFFQIIECVRQQVHEGCNFVPIPAEELELCINILIVDAFIRCKIFKNPVGYSNASS